jgi:hypothetical protein
MSVIVSNNIHGPIEFTTDGATSFLGITFAAPGLFGPRVGIGFGEIVGMVRAVAAVPGIAAGTLHVEQSVDGVAYDHDDPFAVTVAGGTIPFGLKIIGRFIRVRFTVPVGETYDIRFGAHLNPIHSS